MTFVEVPIESLIVTLGVSAGVVARRVILLGPVLDRGPEPVTLRLIRLMVQILPPRRLLVVLPQMLTVLLLPIVLLALMLMVLLMLPCHRLRLLLNKTPWMGQRSTLLLVLRS